MNRFLILGGLAFLTACAPSPWKKYQAAQSCYFDGKEDCTNLYQSAIEAKSDLPGVHASYGTWLLKQGNSAQAQSEFATEVKNYPEAKKSTDIALPPASQSGVK